MQFTFRVDQVGLSSIALLWANRERGDQRGRLEYAEPLWNTRTTLTLDTRWVVNSILTSAHRDDDHNDHKPWRRNEERMRERMGTEEASERRMGDDSPGTHEGRARARDEQGEGIPSPCERR